MNTKKYQLENYRKYLLNRMTATPHIIEYIENALASEDEAAHHSFHKIMIHNWAGSDAGLFDTLGEYFGATFIPVNYTSQGTISTFFTSSLILILKMSKLEFLFPHQRNMFNVDVLFNDKTSADCFENRVTIEDIVSGVVSCRLNEKFELNLSDFCNDPEFKQKKIHFYKLSLLSHFKILMLRMGRDTKILNLSNNSLSQVPIEILNFFIKGDLIAVNFSNNNIPLLSELHRVSSKIEKLWIEGNPLCDEIDPISYVKHIIMKFPRLIELDGVKLNAHGLVLPFFKNYLETPDKKTKMLVEKFMSLYFAHYDARPRNNIDMFYENNATLSITTTFTAGQQVQATKYYLPHAHSIMDPVKRSLVMFKDKIYKSRAAIVKFLTKLPGSAHDPSTFTVDVLKHDKKCLVLVIDGIFKEISFEINAPESFFRFRRTFVFKVHIKNATTEYFISNELFSISVAAKEQCENFKSTTTTNALALRSPDQDDIAAMCNVFCHLTQLKRPEAELRLKVNGWDIQKAMQEFIEDMQLNKISAERFLEDDDFSDLSSFNGDEID